MSVVFDVLDSLNSIRNVEDLKKRWEVDSKRQQTLSYNAVDMFVSLFSVRLVHRILVLVFIGFLSFERSTF